jgi:hypothetical protein
VQTGGKHQSLGAVVAVRWYAAAIQDRGVFALLT